MTKIKLEATTDGETIPIEIEEAEGGLTSVVVGDKNIQVNARRVEPDVWSLIIDGESYEATVQPLNGKIRVTLRGATWEIDVYDPRRKRARSDGDLVVEGTQIISSPMPGRVVRIDVKVGQQVEAGQGVVVVEAMKMENELEAAGPGTVKEIKCEPGQAVEDGQVLVIIE